MAVQVRQSESPSTRPDLSAIGRGSRRAYTLMDVLVSLTVISVLLSLLAPALSGVRETTRKVVCSSNSRQVGLGMAMFADSNRGMLPVSVAGSTPSHRSSNRSVDTASAHPSGPADTLVMRFNKPANAWDGLGWLYFSEYVSAPGVFYCPSHKGEHPYARYADLFGADMGEIVGNYQYRSIAPNGAGFLPLFPSRASLAADGMRTLSDVNHKGGCNVLTGDLTVSWFEDRGEVLASLARSANDAVADDRVMAAWRAIDLQMGIDTGGGTPMLDGPNSARQKW